MAAALLIALSASTALAAPGGVVATPTAYEPTAGNAESPAADTETKARLSQGNNLNVAGDRLHVSLLRAFYNAHNNQLVWDTRADAVKSLWAAVLRAGAQGLDPNSFHAVALADPGGLSPTDRDLLLSDAFLAYADALSRGEDPVEARPGDQILSPGPVDVVAALDAAMNSPQPGAALEALVPSTPQYAGLREGYRRYQAIAKAGGWPRIDAAAPEERFKQLQKRLAAENYLPADYATGKYDEATVAAAKAFQEHHGFEPDGKLGPSTVAELNVTAEARVQQIAVGLERQRWLPHTPPANRVVVNTAAMQIEYFRDNQPAFTGRVIVGQVTKQTPEFEATIKSLLYNPPWNVPVDIAEKEIFSKLDEEPDYLERHNMVMRDNGSVTQLPGAGTALGYLKFEMEDRFDVYLHDTPLRYLFARENRRLSHGCVRVQNPRDLASLLSGEPVEAINKGIAQGGTSRHMLPTPVPVFITYQTSFIGADGQVQFRRDAYSRDEAVWRHLVPTGQLPLARSEAPAQRKG